jgi:hypothetical protein
MTMFIGIIVILHGLVHFWYVTLSQGWVAFQPEMGWTGKSWLLSNLMGDQITRILATVLYSLAAITFLIAGIGLVAGQGWTRMWLSAASLISIVAILLFWDGNFSKPVEKGALGLLISTAILFATVVLKWPAV